RSAPRRTQRLGGRALPRTPDGAEARRRARLRARAARVVDARRAPAGRRCDVPPRTRARGVRADRVATEHGEGRARAVKALVTGGEGGIGRAIRARLEREGLEVRSLDILDGFDVSDPAAWEEVDAVEVACLNAGVLTGTSSIRDLTDEQYAHALAVNVDGVVLGVRRLAHVMDGGAIVVTASLAGLTGMPSDPI